MSELRRAILRLMGATVAASDQAQTMTDEELAERLLTGRWTTIEVHEAGRRLKKHGDGYAMDAQAREWAREAEDEA